MSSASRIAEYIERNQYASLVDLIIHGQELTEKDKKDIYLYLKRVNGLVALNRANLFHVGIAGGDYTHLPTLINNNFLNFTYREKIMCFQTILQIVDYKKLLEILPEKFYTDKDFFDYAMQSWDRFPDYFKAKFTKFFNIHKVLYDENMRNLFRQFVSTAITHFVEELGPFIIEARKNLETWVWLENMIRDNLDSHGGFRVYKFSTVVFFADHFDLNQLIPERMKQYYFQNYYNLNKEGEEIKLFAIEHFVKKGYKKITNLFNQALVYRDKKLMELLLPFKPRLATALKHIEKLSDSDEDKSLKDLITTASQKSRRKKIPGVDNPEKTNEDLD